MSETSVYYNETTLRNIPEGAILITERDPKIVKVNGLNFVDGYQNILCNLRNKRYWNSFPVRSVRKRSLCVPVTHKTKSSRVTSCLLTFRSWVSKEM